MKKIILTTIIAPFLFQTSVFASGPHTELPPAKCEADFPSFEAWRADFKREALASGVTEDIWNQAERQMKPDANILRKDNSQGGFYVDFLKFSQRGESRVSAGRKVFNSYRAIFSAVEKQYGVSSEILAAFWGMESDFATKMTRNLSPIITSMTTLAYDCRRAALFRLNLLSALLLLKDKDMELDELQGQWAGEMSGLQFTPANLYQYGVDFNRDGRRDVVNSIADMMGTAANVFKDYGWKAGQPYILEVKVPDQMAWQNADLTLEKMFPMSYWANQGVTLPDGSPLVIKNLQASLMLPMGRFGPTFLAFDNFKTILMWNASLNNALTASYLASRIKDESLRPMSKGKKSVEVMSKEQLIEFQTLAAKHGFDIGDIDGFLGTRTRAVTQELQLKWGLPADSYPTSEILNILRKM